MGIIKMRALISVLGGEERYCPESAAYCFCGTTTLITSEDFASCELAYGSFVFSIVSGVYRKYFSVKHYRHSLC